MTLSKGDEEMNRKQELEVIQRLAKKYMAKGYTPERGGEKMAKVMLRFRIMGHKKTMREQNPMCGI